MSGTFSPTDPLPVSVIVPVYNRRTELAKSVASIRAQRPRGPKEIIVVDDASTDGSADAAEALGCTVVRLPINGGSAAARNAGLQRVRTPWVSFLDSDDEWHDDLLATLWPQTAGRVVVSGAGLLMVDGTLRTLLGAVAPPGHALRSPADLLVPPNPIVTSATIARTDILNELAGFRVDLRVSEDFDLWLRVLEHGPGWCDARPVITYHRGSDAKSQQGHGHVELARAGIAKSFTGRPWWTIGDYDRYLGSNYWEGARSALRSRKPVPAARHLARVLAKPRRTQGMLENILRNRRRRARAASLS